MKKISEEQDETSEGLNQIMEIINAKGDAGELKDIVSRTPHKQQSPRKEE